MSSQRFRHAPALPDLPKGSERAIIAQFKAIQNDLDEIRGFERATTEVVATDCLVRVGQLLLIAPPAAGMRVGIPPATAQNLSQSLRIAVVGGILSPGATVSIVGGRGTVNGAATLALNSFRLVELVSCGEAGWFYST